MFLKKKINQFSTQEELKQMLISLYLLTCSLGMFVRLWQAV